MTMTNDCADIAARLAEAERSGVAIAPIRDALGDGGIPAAYEVQRLNSEARTAAGARLVGRKIGLTSKAVQAQLGVDQPDFGALFDDMILPDGVEIEIDRVCQPRVEAEVAVVLAAAVEDPALDIDGFAAAVDYVRPSIEIVGSRIADWNITILDTIADNASCGAIVLGEQQVDPSSIDLASVQMSMEVNGSDASAGTGADCLGHPFNAGLWLAQKMIEQGTPLQAGDIVMTGALGPMVALAPGDQVVAKMSGLGEVSMSRAAN